MWSQLKHAVENERSTLKEYVTPIPTVILDDIVGFGLHPQVESNQSDTSDPPEKKSTPGLNDMRYEIYYLITWTATGRPSGIRKHANANIQ